MKNKNYLVVGKFKIETPKNFWIDEFVCLRSNAYSFKCKNEDEEKVIGVSKSQSKHIKFEDFKKNVWMVKNIKENVINIFFVQLTMKCIFKK